MHLVRFITCFFLMFFAFQSIIQSIDRSTNEFTQSLIYSLWWLDSVAVKTLDLQSRFRWLNFGLTSGHVAIRSSVLEWVTVCGPLNYLGTKPTPRGATHLPSPWGRKIEHRPVWLEIMAGRSLVSDGRSVCDSIWQLTLRCSEVSFP